MRKLLSAVLVTVLFLTGCSASTKPQEIEINRNFAAKATITQNSAAYTADFEINENGCSAAFVSPEEISGLKISFDGNSFTYTFNELEFTSPPKNEVQQFLSLIYSAINDRTGVLIKEETHYSVQGSTQYGTYYINVNNKMLIPTFLEIEQADLAVRFEQPQTPEQIAK